MLLFAACSAGGTAGPTPTVATTPTASQTAGGSTPTPGSGSPSPTATTITAPEPPTLTTCPAAGTARAAVTAPLALGSHQTIVYMVTQFSGSSATSTLNRFDLATGTKTGLLTQSNVTFLYPQISADGAWVLFIAQTGQQEKIQMVRMDGQGLQTLYCASSMYNLIWSSNQHLALFGASSTQQGFSGVYLLNLQQGTVQLELKPAQTNLGSASFLPITWIDNTRAYVYYSGYPIAPNDQIGLLDTSLGPNQTPANIKQVYQDKTSPAFNYPCFDADSSYDGSTLYVAQCSGISAPNSSGSGALGTREGPSSISTEPSAGGTQRALFTSQALGIAAVRSISNNLLLIQVENFSQNHTVDRSQNGLWSLHSDGTSMTRLTTEASGVQTTLCQFSQNPWSNVSRDGSVYAFETVSSGYPATYTLSYAPLSGGPAQSFATIADGSQLAVVGWTSM